MRILKNCQCLEAQTELWNHSWIFWGWKRPCCSCLIFWRTLPKNNNHPSVLLDSRSFCSVFESDISHRDRKWRVVYHFPDKLFQLCLALSARKCRPSTPSLNRCKVLQSCFFLWGERLKLFEVLSSVQPDLCSDLWPEPSITAHLQIFLLF